MEFPTHNLSEVKDNALQVHALFKSGASKESLLDRFPEFAKAVPSLFNMCCMDKLDMDNLNMLFRLSNQLRSGTVSDEDAIMKFGAHMLPKSMSGDGRKN